MTITNTLSNHMVKTYEKTNNTDISTLITKKLQSFATGFLYYTKHYLGLTQAARVREELEKLTVHELNDVGITPCQIDHIVEDLKQKRL